LRDVGSASLRVIEQQINLKAEATEIARAEIAMAEANLANAEAVSGRSSKPSKLINVDLPEPDRPTIATNSPRLIESDTSETAETTEGPTRYSLER
jgi:hypothetical protein